MWTGFRLHLGGAQKYFKVDADLACYSKAVANGIHCLFWQVKDKSLIR